jgi:peptidoglycan L-alanyl-D-glutamate endopeptidase CwlK
MIKHSEFISWLRTQYPNTPAAQLERISVKTANGILPDALFTDMVVQPAPIAPPPIATGFVLGKTSVERLSYCKLELQKCVRRAIQLTTQDFTVMETLRTLETQKKYLANGTTRTLKSKHLKQPDGTSWAVDLGAWNDGKVTWGFDDYFEIVQAMDKAATELGIADHIRWGGIWDMTLADYGGINLALYRSAVEGYKTRHAGSDFLDGPHFEWVA